MNYVDWFNRQLFDPGYYQRQFENDLPKDEGVVTRVAQIALPFVSLYRPAGSVISLSMGSLRVINNGISVASAESSEEVALRVGRLGLAGLALAGSVYNFTLGLYVTTLADFSTNVVHAIGYLEAGNRKMAAEELAQAASCLLYLSIMASGSLEVTLASLLFQAVMSFYQSWDEERMPEKVAKALMGFARIYQGTQQFQTIRRRDALLAYQKYRALAKRVQKSREIDHLYEHPLVALATVEVPEPELVPVVEKVIEKSLPLGLELDHPLASMASENQTVLVDGNGNEYDFGSHYHGVGKGTVKGMNVCFREVGDQTELDFKVNHVFRYRIEEMIDDLEDMDEGEMNELLQIFQSNIEGVHISVEGDDWGELNYVIALEGLGTIYIGASDYMPNLYDRVRVRMDKGKTIYDFHEALAFFELDDALRESAIEDIERMKLGVLFRTFFPYEATYFERMDEFFDLPIDELRQRIIEMAPEMEFVIHEYLPRMELREILPGRSRFAIRGLADELRDRGAVGLTTALTGAWTQEDVNERVASILKMGFLCSEMRDNNGINKDGLSSGMDYYSGAADSVFTQLVTDQTESWDDFFYYDEGIRFLINLDAVEMGTYQYHDDNFGNRLLDSWFWGGDYRSRSNIFDFVQEERAWFNYDHELMLKERLSPDLITGLIVHSEEMKLELIRHLDATGVIVNGWINSKPIDDFIHVGSAISANLF